MCAVFGLLDFKGTLSPSERLRIIQALSKAAEIRGTDATGIAFVQGNGIQIQKAPKPAHLMRYRIDPNARFIMGHTRMTTQGSEKRNQNNHPFPGKAGLLPFALAHNGVLFNDMDLQRKMNLPRTKVETDSYVAVQLLEQAGKLNAKTLKSMAEQLEGTFTITVLDKQENLYLVKGNNPLTLYLFPKRGFYLYASTTEILELALADLNMVDELFASIPIKQGDIMQISRDGQRTVTRFDDSRLTVHKYYSCCGYYDWYVPTSRAAKGSPETETYTEQVIRYGMSLGIPENDLRRLVDYGYDAFDLEELLFDSELRQCCLDELTCELGVW